MNRERAETYLRLLAEAGLRNAATTLPPAPRPADPFVTTPASLTRAAWALTVVGALDLETAEDILADAELALLARYSPEPPEAGVITSTGPIWSAGLAGPRLGPRRFASPRPLAQLSKPMPGSAAPGPPAAGLAPEGPDRYVPVGLMILFHDQTISGELDLMSYAHTASGARLVAGWRTRDPLGSYHPDLPPVGQISVLDDRGRRYRLSFDTKGRPESACDLGLSPDPPSDIRWLDITAPGEHAVRVDLERQADCPAPEVSDVGVSVGEHLLSRIAERLLVMTPNLPADPLMRRAGPLASSAAGLGAVIAALEAAEVLSPASPVPGRLATLCASLRIGGHGITAAPAPDLPEPWLSLLAHYHRRKPDTAPTGDGFAAVAAALPELDGLRLVLLGLHNWDGSTWMNALAAGRLPDLKQGALGADLAFPLSIWIRDSAGRWHVARPASWHDQGGEAALTFRLTPPLSRCSDWIEVRAAGRSAEVRAIVPLYWGYAP